MLIMVLEALGNMYSAYRAAHDSGFWIVEPQLAAIQNYMESFVIANAPKES